MHGTVIIKFIMSPPSSFISVLKQALRSSGANATEKHIEDVSLCSMFLMKADEEFGVLSRSTKHNSRSFCWYQEGGNASDWSQSHCTNDRMYRFTIQGYYRWWFQDVPKLAQTSADTGCSSSWWWPRTNSAGRHRIGLWTSWCSLTYMHTVISM